jgi:large subunit ribosomal protein L27
MAHVKAGGAVKGNRDSVAKRLGIKAFAGEKVKSGSIIVRQKGSHFWPGLGTKQGTDYTIYSVMSGVVKFIKRQGKKVITVTK